MNEGEFLRPQEAAAVLGVRAKTVSRWAEEGRLPAIKTIGGHRRFRRADVERLAGQMRRGA